MTVSKALRFSDDEYRQIQQFLDKNPFFDFSTLARVAILEFIRNPKLEINAVTSATERGQLPRSKREH